MSKIILQNVRLTKDIEVIETKLGSFGQMTVADNFVHNKEKKVTYFSVNLFGGYAATLKNMVGKGCRVNVIGDFRLTEFDKDGVKYHRAVVDNPDVTIIDYKPKEEYSESQKMTTEEIEAYFAQ